VRYKPNHGASAVRIYGPEIVTGSFLTRGPFFSSEPGYYEDGEFGIRLETVVMAVPAKTQVRLKNPKQSLGFCYVIIWIRVSS